MTSANKPTLARLAAEGAVYETMAKQFKDVVFEKKIAGELERLMKAQQQANRLFSEAVTIRDKAFERQKKWEAFGTVAALLGAAASAVGSANESAANAKANYDYMVLEVASKQTTFGDSKVRLNEFYIRYLDVKPDNLPQTEMDHPH